MNTTYFLGRHDDILCHECGESVDDAIQCTNKMYRVLTCAMCGNEIPFVGQQRKANEDLGSRGNLNGPSQGFNLLKK